MKIAQAYKDLKDQLQGWKGQEKDPLQEAYYMTFSSANGRVVLANMLAELHVFDELLEDEEVILSNYGKKLLSHIGIIREDNIMDIVKFYTTLVRTKIQQQESQREEESDEKGF
jgi:hypothetical protein